MSEHEKPLPSLEAFEKKLANVRGESASKEVPAAGMALRLGAEFASGVLVGVGIGLLLDNWWNTRPLMLLLCMCFGTAAGVKTMMRTLHQMENSDAPAPKLNTTPET